MQTEIDLLISFIEQQYHTKIRAIHTMADGAKKVYRIARADGPDWVARVYPTEPYEGLPVNFAALTAVLDFLAQAAYPAERIIPSRDGASVNQWRDKQLLLTTFVGQSLTGWQPAEQARRVGSPGQPNDRAYTPETLSALGATIGRLHCLQPPATLPQAGMLPGRELGWVGAQLQEIAIQVPAQWQTKYEQLVAAVQQADRYTDLPPTLIHNDCNLSNIVLTPTGQIRLIDWESAGRGPALIDVGILLSNCFSKQRLQIEEAAIQAIVAGYSQYRRLSEAELARLPDAIRFFRLVLLAGYFPDLMQQKIRPDELLYGATYAQWQAQYAASDEIAALASRYFRRA